MARKHRCDFEYAAVRSRGKWFMVTRCVGCGQFGNYLLFVREPFASASKIALKDVPRAIRKYINIISAQTAELFKIVDLQIYIIRED